MRQINFIPDEHYHIFNRGNNKSVIFWDDYDRAKLLTLILFCQGKVPMPRITRMTPFVLQAIKTGRHLESIVSKHGEKTIEETLATREVKIGHFCAMPTHFHFEGQELKEGGISRMMQRLGNSFTKYVNAKYNRSGHVFEGTFQARHIFDNDQLLNISTYIHNNPRGLKNYLEKEHLYPWSSFQDYASVNRWGELLDTSSVLEQFKKPEEYKIFVNQSDTKLMDT